MDGVQGQGDEPRWLDPVELEAWIQVAVMMANLPAALDAQLQRDSGLSHFEYEVLSVLSDSRGLRLRMSELAALAGGSVSRLSHVVTRLERRGLVERHPCPDDARSILAHLTGDGYRAVVQAAPGYVENVRRLVIDRLGREQIERLAEIGAAINDEVPRIARDNARE